jgi:uncharacterized protein
MTRLSEKNNSTMSVPTILLLLIVGLAAGVLSGLVGLGGGVIIVPALVYLMGFNQHQATGTSLGILLLPAGIFAVLNYYQKGYIDVKVVLLIFAGFLVGGWLGSKISLNISEGTLKKVFAVVLILIAGKVLFFDK